MELVAEGVARQCTAGCGVSDATCGIDGEARTEPTKTFPKRITKLMTDPGSNGAANGRSGNTSEGEFVLEARGDADALGRGAGQRAARRSFSNACTDFCAFRDAQTGGLGQAATDGTANGRERNALERELILEARGDADALGARLCVENRVSVRRHSLRRERAVPRLFLRCLEVYCS
ncbi:MAG: hypothetical protein AAFY34_12025 [Pseudomonadota bacterium]